MRQYLRNVPKLQVKSEVSERQNYIDDDDQLDFEAEDSVSGK